MTDTINRRNRSQLLLILLIAFGTVGGSYLLFYTTRDAGVWGTVNHGEFVEPAVQVGDLGLRREGGAPFEVGETWWLVVAVDGQCDPECVQALHQLRQLHVLLNKDVTRVRRALVTLPGQDVEELLGPYPQVAHLTIPGAELGNAIYIVDPVGNLVFRYPLADAGKPVLEDLKRLLKLSMIG